MESRLNRSPALIRQWPWLFLFITSSLSITAAERATSKAYGHHGHGHGNGHGQPQPSALALALAPSLPTSSSLLQEDPLHDPPKFSDPPSAEELEKGLGEVKSSNEAKIEASNKAVAAAKDLKKYIQAIVDKAHEGAKAAKETHESIDKASKTVKDSSAKIVEPEIKAGLDDAEKRFGGASGL